MRIIDVSGPRLGKSYYIISIILDKNNKKITKTKKTKDIRIILSEF